MVDVTFLAGQAPLGDFEARPTALAADKAEFGSQPDPALVRPGVVGVLSRPEMTLTLPESFGRVSGESVANQSLEGVLDLLAGLLEVGLGLVGLALGLELLVVGAPCRWLSFALPLSSRPCSRPCPSVPWLPPWCGDPPVTHGSVLHARLHPNG